MGGRFREPAARFQPRQGAIVASPMAFLPRGALAFLSGKAFSMLPQALQLIPYVAIALAILLSIAIVMICFNQGSRRIDWGVSWRQSILSVFQRFWSVMSRTRLRQPGVIIHDPNSSKPHDLDDPFFDPEVRERVGAVIANAALKRVKP